MLRLAAVFFVIALIAALFGIGFAANLSLEGRRFSSSSSSWCCLAW